MKCIDFKENINEFIDGELENSRINEVTRHLDECVECKSEVESLRALRTSLKGSIPVAAPSSVDSSVISSFRSFHDQRRKTDKRTSWFGVPRLAFATGLLMFALIGVSAFQLGRLSVAEKKDAVNSSSPQLVSNPIEQSKNLVAKEEPKTLPKETIVEVPVIKEKIVRVVKTKIVTRIVYRDRKTKKAPGKTLRPSQTSPPENNKYMAQTDLKAFQPVSRVTLKVTKKGDKK